MVGLVAEDGDEEERSGEGSEERGRHAESEQREIRNCWELGKEASPLHAGELGKEKEDWGC